MEKQDKAIIKALTDFLKEANKPKYAIDSLEELIDKYFELDVSWDWILYVHLKTSEGTFSHWYTLDISIEDTENLFEWIKAYSKRILYAHYDIDA